MTKERHNIAAGRAFASSSPSSARPDSLASLGGDGASSAGASSSQIASAAAASSSHSAPRSRKKVKHRSSLEFLDGGNTNSSSGMGGVGADSAKDGSSKRKRKLAPVSPSASANTPSATKRLISPRSKSKLESLTTRTEPSDQSKGVNKKMSGSKSEKRSAVSDGKQPSSTAVPSNKKSVVKVKRNVPDTKLKEQQPVASSIMESSSKCEAKNVKDHFTPKMNRINNNRTQQKETPEVSYSPLDYRVEKNSAVNRNVKGGADTPGLETYVEQWTRPSPDKSHQDTTAMKQETKGGAMNDNNQNHEEGGDSQELLDDLSSSVVSTSSNSENDDDEEEGGGGGYYDGTMVKSNQSSSEPQLNLESNFMPSVPPQINQNLQTEYGKLAFMKQELERKMQLRKYDAETCNPWGSGHLPSVSSSDGFMNAGKAGVAVGSNDKQLLLSNHDNLAIASKNSPPREDVAYGKMIFQRMVEEQNKDVSWPGKQEQGRSSSNPQESRDERRGYHEGDSYKIHQEVNHHGHDDRYDQRQSSTERHPPSKPKPKKKRKRRVVETITRVIHEESEEEGSASTQSGGERSRDYQYSQHRSPPARDPHVSDSASYRRDGYSPSRSIPSRRPQYYTKRSMYSPDRESRRAPLRHHGEYDEYGDHSDRVSSASEGGNGHHLSYEGKRGSPQRNSKRSNSPEKKRRKSSQQSPSRGRSHTGQHSMLESL